MILLVFVNMLFSLTYIIISYTIKYIHPLWLLAVRMLLAGLISLIYQFLRDKKLLYIQKKDYWYIFITILLHMYINFFSETYALQNITPILTSIFYLTSPLFSAILDFFYKNKILSFKQIIIMILGSFTSILMIILNNTNITTSSTESNISSYVLLAISIISSTLAWHRIQYIRENSHYSLVTINGYAALISGILFSMNILYLPTTHTPAINQVPLLFFSALLLALFSNIIGYNTYSALLNRYNITTILFAEMMAPCFTAYYEWIFFNIPPKINHIIFFIFFIILIALFHHYERNHAAQTKDI